MPEISNGDLTIDYQVFGQGNIDVIALHGHSKTVYDFEDFGNKDVRVIAMHLFHHGNSSFPIERINKTPLRPEEFYDLVEEILQKENVKTFHLLAYSQGGRFALKLVEAYASSILSINLLSPDGIDLKGFYDRMAHKWYNLYFMQFLERNPRFFLGTIKIAHRLGFVHQKIVDLAEDFTKNKTRMLCASRTWRNFRNIQTSPARFGEIVQEHQIPTQILMGNRDGIFPPKIAHRFEKESGLQGIVKVLDCGHDFFKERAKLLFIPLLPFPNNGYICSKPLEHAEDFK